MNHALIAALLALAAAPYDPLRIDRSQPVARMEITVTDRARDRVLPVRLTVPAGRGRAPVVLFSHGLGGSRGNSAFLAEHWARRGYVVASLQHPGSDDSVWRGVPAARRAQAMRNAASAANLKLRAQDVTAVLDELARLDRRKGHPLAGRLDLERVGMSGHSFGAATTQAVSGQRYPRAGAAYTDRRIKAAIPMSPTAPRLGRPDDAFGRVSVPWLLMTGTEDDAAITGTRAADRRAVFAALPPGDRYELVLDGARHSVFGDRGAANPNHHRAILALSTAFWDAHLRGDGAARAWLKGAGPRTVLQSRDQWRGK